MLLSDLIKARKTLEVMRRLADYNPPFDEGKGTYIRPYVVPGYIRKKQKRKRKKNGKW